MEYIEEVMKQLRDKGGLDLEKENDVAGFLGVSIVKQEDGNILMTQSGLAIKVIEALQIDKLPRKYTPAETTPLVKNDYKYHTIHHNHHTLSHHANNSILNKKRTYQFIHFVRRNTIAYSNCY